MKFIKIKQNIKTIFQICFIIILTGLITGCYNLGVPKPPFNKVYVSAPENNSYAPQSQKIIWQNIRELLLKSGSVSLVSSESEADVVLKTSIEKYLRPPIALDENNPDSYKTLSLTITLKYSLFDRTKNKYLIDNQSITETIIVINDMSTQQAEYQKFPELSRNIASRLVNSILNVW